MPLTLDEIRRQGLHALQRELGRAGMVRFLQQFEHGHGDYTLLRKEWVDQHSLEELRSLCELVRPPKKTSKGGSSS